MIPAAGVGSRFLPLTRVVPKELFLLGDRPLLHHALDEVARGGFDAAVVVVAPWKRPVFERYLEGASDIGIEVSFIEQERPAGIGDAVIRAAPRADERFGVMLPDDVVLESSHWQGLRDADGVAVCVREVPLEEVGRFGIVEARDGVAIRLVEKPAPGTIDSRLAIFGRYVLDGAVVEALQRLAAQRTTGELQLTDGLAEVSPVHVVEFSSEIYDCGTPDAYLEATARWYARTQKRAGP